MNEYKCPTELKHLDVIPLFKKKDPANKENYRPVILLVHSLKVFEKLYINK